MKSCMWPEAMRAKSKSSLPTETEPLLRNFYDHVVSHPLQAEQIFIACVQWLHVMCLISVIQCRKITKFDVYVASYFNVAMSSFPGLPLPLLSLLFLYNELRILREIEEGLAYSFFLPPKLLMTSTVPQKSRFFVF